MTYKQSKLALVIAATIGFSGSAFALDPQSIQVTDGVQFTPTLRLAERHDDNIYATKKNRKSSWVTQLQPSFTLSLDQAKSAYQLQYSAERNIYHSSHSDDHTNHHLTGAAGFEFNSKNRLVLDAGYHKMEDTASDNDFYRNDKWNTKNIGGVYTFGARTARTQIDLAANYEELRYDNNSRLGGERVNKDKERDTSKFGVTGYYQVAPKTKALLEARYTDYDYKSNKSRDSDNKALLAGVTWEATAKTTGTVKVGREKKSYDKSVYKDKSMNMWEAAVAWAPRTYSTFDFKMRRGFDEGTNYYDVDDLDINEHVSSSIKTTAYHVGWNHRWLDRLSTKMHYTRTDRKYQQISRDDKINQYGIGVNYEMRRWLDVGLGYTHRDNDSNISSRDYKRNIYALTFNASL
ncbi:outer membrane beta-barrel protein [Thiopseudomonas alkaliphila]|uniref:outer membrane beta-barrel protein n=1 Tax=Thiopseudomonas alkaliphila TaxID=1697053 RepID=UPI0035713930